MTITNNNELNSTIASLSGLASLLRMIANSDAGADVESEVDGVAAALERIYTDLSDAQECGALIVEKANGRKAVA